MDSNQRLQASKACALPLGDGPKAGECHSCHPPILREKEKQKPFSKKKGGHRESNPGPPEPQSGAITNYAMATMLFSQTQFPIKSRETCFEQDATRSRALLLSDPEGIRTPDPRLRRPLLYPAELLNQNRIRCDSFIVANFILFVKNFYSKR